MPAAALKIALAVHSLSSGGAERVASLLAGGFARRGHSVLVLTALGPSTDFFPLGDGVLRRSIGPLRSGGLIRNSWNAALRPARLRGELNAFRPDLVISFMSLMNVRVLLAALGTGVPVVVTEHTHPRLPGFPWFWRAGRRLTYPRAARLVGVSAGVSDGFAWLDPALRANIPNPLPADLEAQRAARPEWEPPAGRRLIASMGRLDRLKGMDLVIRAFSRLASEHPDWDLAILGEGGERRNLENLANNLGIGSRVHLPGALRNPFPTLAAADLFALASRWEGFGNALIEAMACGVAVIAADCPCGPAEIVRSDHDGILVPPESPTALAAALERLMGDDALRRRLGEAGAASAARYRLDTVLGRWDELVDELRAEHRIMPARA